MWIRSGPGSLCRLVFIMFVTAYEIINQTTAAYHKDSKLHVLTRPQTCSYVKKTLELVKYQDYPARRDVVIN